MGKQGPCYHCGTKTTPLWRNGPPEKPVLCNACGSRWRTKGTLANYVPTHARASFSFLDSEDSQNSLGDKLPCKKHQKHLRINVHNEGVLDDEEMFAGYKLASSCFEDKTTNRSSSESAISCSESCAELRSMDRDKIPGYHSVRSNFWDSHIPSRKRSTIIRRCVSTVERLHRDLYNILLEQESSGLSECSEGLLIYGREDPMPSPEIGLGCVLLKQPVSSTEVESEASLHLMENKASCSTTAFMGSSCLFGQSQNNEISSSQAGKEWVDRDIVGADKPKVNTATQSFLRNKFLVNSHLSNFVVQQHKYSPQIPINLKSANKQGSNLGKEISACSSHLIGGAISLPAKRPPDPLYFQNSGGTSSQPVKYFKIPKERNLVDIPSSTCLSAALQIRNQGMVSTKPVQVESHDKDLQMKAHSQFSCRKDGLPLHLTPAQRAHKDEEQKPSVQMFKYPNPLSLSKNQYHGIIQKPE